MPLTIGAAIGGFLVTLGVPLALGTAIGTLVVNLAISAALSFAIAVLTRGESPLPTPSDNQVEIRQPLAPRVRSYGTVRVSGSVWWFAAIDRVLYLGLALNHGRIGRFATFHIDENQVDLDVNDKVTSAPYSAGNVFIHHRLGTTPETKYSEIFTGFGVDEVRGDGVATVLATFENPTAVATFQNTYPSGRPEVRATIEASVVWDPREDVSLGGTQDRDDPTTWEFSDNPVVCLLDYMTSVDGYGIPFSKFEPNLAQWIEAAEVCDEPVALLAGGFGKRYLIAGTYRLSDAPRDVVAKFTSTFDGRVWSKRDGTVGVLAGVFVEPTVTLTQAHIAGWSDLTRGQDPIKSIIGVRGEYMSPEHDYREHEAEPWPTADAAMAEDDERVASLDLLWVPSNSQARRLMKRHYMRATAEWHGTIITNAYGLKAMDERFVRIQIPELDLDQSFEVLNFGFDPASGLACQIEVVSVDATIDDWDPSEEGTEEATALAFVDDFEKSGTTFDPIAEMGAQIGEYVLLGCANVTGFPATPAGWELPAPQQISGGLAISMFGKQIDGTETSQVFQSASGPMIAIRLRGVRDVGFQFAASRIEAGAFGDSWNSSSVPFLVLVFAAANSNFDEPDWIRLTDNVSKTNIEDHTFRQMDTVTAHMDFAIYLPGETPPTGFVNNLASDRGTNAAVWFNLVPG